MIAFVLGKAWAAVSQLVLVARMMAFIFPSEGLNLGSSFTSLSLHFAMFCGVSWPALTRMVGVLGVRIIFNLFVLRWTRFSLCSVQGDGAVISNSCSV